jgi:hypothetical protein
MPPFLQPIGADCLLLVVLTHIAEALHWFPSMRWGEPNSVTHYVDLFSAALGVSALVVAIGLRVVRARSSPP